jgi:hypothetical protein
MQLNYAILANDAGHLHDGRMCIFGAGIDAIESTGFPFQFSCALIVKLILLPDEPLEDHSFRIEVSRPDGKRTPKPTNSPVATIRNKLDPKLPSSASICNNVILGMDQPGCYVFHVVVDDKEIASVPLHVFAATPEEVKRLVDEGK